MKLQIVREGEWRVLAVCTERGDCDLLDFLEGKTDQAYDLIREAANKLPDNAEVQYHLAAVLAKKGDKDEAVKLLRKAVSGQLPASVKPEAQKLLEQLTK